MHIGNGLMFLIAVILIKTTVKMKNKQTNVSSLDTVQNGPGGQLCLILGHMPALNA